MAALPSGKDIMNMFDVSVNRIRHLLLNGMYGKYPTRHVCRRTGLAVKDIALAVDHNWMIGTLSSFPIDLCCIFATMTNCDQQYILLDEATSGRAGKKVGDSKGQTAFTVVHQSTGEIFKQDISFNLVKFSFLVSNTGS